jgi:hypothetical protein
MARAVRGSSGTIPDRAGGLYLARWSAIGLRGAALYTGMHRRREGAALDPAAIVPGTARPVLTGVQSIAPAAQPIPNRLGIRSPADETVPLGAPGTSTSKPEVRIGDDSGTVIRPWTTPAQGRVDDEAGGTHGGYPDTGGEVGIQCREGRIEPRLTKRGDWPQRGDRSMHSDGL